MSNKIFALTLIFLAFLSLESFAQEKMNLKPVKDLRQTMSKEQRLKMKQEVRAKKEATRLGTAKNLSGRQVLNNYSDIKLNKDEQMFSVNSYKVDFPVGITNGKDKSLVAINLYTDYTKQVASIQFYTEGSKAISTKISLDDKELPILTYPMSMFDYILNFVNESKKVVMVYDYKKKQAYLTSDVVANRAR